MKRSILFVAGAIAVSMTVQSAHADLLFSDDFNSYSSGLTLNGDVNPGNNAAWNGGSAGLTVVSGGLTYGSLYTDSSGNMLSIANGTAASITNGFADQTSGTVFYSFLFEPTVVDSGNTYFTALNPSAGAKPFPNGSTDVIDAYYYSNGNFNLRANPAGAATGAALTLNTTYFIVEEIDLTAQTASLWINPSSLGGSAPAATVSLSGLTAGESVSDIGFKAQTGTGSFYIDNILIGTTWADVTTAPSPVPEPSVLALAGLGLTGLVLRLRRR